MEQQMIDVDDESEYEYDDVETETFFVDIDLSSLNPTIIPNNSAVHNRVTPAKRKIDDSATQTPDPADPNPDNAGSHAENTRLTTMQRPRDKSVHVAESDQDTMLPFPPRVQILDLNSVNPIVSYQGQVFSCTWSDMVGTNMFFTHPEMTNTTEPLRSTEDYDLIGMSRIKLVGQRAKPTKKAPEATEADGDVANEQPADNNDALSGQDAGSQTKEKQASFLERLMEIKQQRGETDIVRTFVDDQIASADLEKVHEFHREEIQALNARVVRGDANALARLQEIYSQPDEEGSRPETLQRAEAPHNEANETM